MKLSVVIPVYNAAECLDVCMYKLIDQVRALRRDERGYMTDNPDTIKAGVTDVSVEIITVDDGSDDRSLTILKEYADRYDFVKLIHQENAGPAAARNAGLRVTTGDWVWFIDPDDYADEDALEVIFAAVKQTDDGRAPVSSDVIIFDACEHAGVNGSDEKISAWEHFGETCFFSSEDDIRALQRAVLYPKEIRTLAGSRPGYGSSDERGTKVKIPGRIVPLAAPWDKIYRRSFLAENHLIYNEELRVLDDMYFNMEVIGCAKRVDYVKKPIYHYVRNDGSITSSYTEDRVSRDLVVWEAIDRYLESQGDMEQLRQAYYKRVIRSYAICCKRSIFHTDNPMGRSERIKYAERVMRLPEYDEAFKSVRLSELEWMLKPVAILGRLRCGVGMCLLSRMERSHA